MVASLTPAQQIALDDVIAGPATHVLGVGGSRSGKTALFTRCVVARALKAPGSRHAILRFKFNHLKASVILDTFPKVMSLFFPGVKYGINKSDWFAELGDSQIWFGGLDEKERTDKILGQEHATLYFNEVSQIPYDSVATAVTRMAQLVEQRIAGLPPSILRPRAFYDENPTTRGHWTYQLFVKKVDPDSKKPLKNPEDYAYFRINPADNLANLAPGYLETLKALPAKQRKRFLEGDWGDDTPGALFAQSDIDKWRVTDDDELPEAVRIVIAVDPSGSDDIDNAHNDEIGIVSVGLGTDGNAYVFEDCSCKAGPATWGRITTDAFDRLEADVVVGETNFGGAMVKHVIQTARRDTPFKSVTASRGKHVRAEPFSALFSQGKVRLFGFHQKLEDELCAMSTYGYTGQGSPNRADALIWALAELFPHLVRDQSRKSKSPIIQPFRAFDRDTGI